MLSVCLSTPNTAVGVPGIHVFCQCNTGFANNSVDLFTNLTAVELCLRASTDGRQVTRVGRGDKLGEASRQMPFEDMTVEDLLRIVRGLPPEESAVAAVARGLYYLDSRALAALLKELAKVHCWKSPLSFHKGSKM